MSVTLFLLALVAGLIGLGWGFVAIVAGASTPTGDASPKTLMAPAVILLAAFAMFVMAFFL